MPELITNMRGDRAFHKPTAQIIRFGIAAGFVGLLSTTLANPVDASHRSVWAVRWAAQHPNQEASYLRSIRSHHYRIYRTARRERVHHASHAWKPNHEMAHASYHALAPLPSYRVASIAPMLPFVKLPAHFHAIMDTSVVQAGDTNVTLDFAGADISDVLKALAMQTHSNIVAGKDVTGAITVSLANVTLDEALDMITKLSGYQYAKVGRTYVVGTQATVAALTNSGTASAPATTAVIVFNYSDPTDLSSFLETRFPTMKVSAGKSSTGKTSGGILVITGTESDIEDAKAFVAETEAALSKGIVSANTQVYRIKYADTSDLVTVLSRLVPGVVITPGPSMSNDLRAPTTADSSSVATTTAPQGQAQGGAGGAGTAPGPTTTLAANLHTPTLLLSGPDEEITRALDLLAKIDVKPAQINYDAKVAEVNLDSAKNVGLMWDLSNARTSFSEVSPAGGSNSAIKFGTIGRTLFSNFAQVQLNAMVNSGDAKILSDPNISAVDGQQAAVFIGDTINYVSSITQTATGQNVTTASVNIGIKLYVTGKVNNDGYVTLNIHPEVSTISGYLSVPGGGSLPQISTREATTTVRVKDGDVLAIGGLISQDDIKNINKIPLLGDLPFLGSLFRNTSKTHHRDEIVIFVKVNVSKDSV